jgi:hypothetical protein
LPFQQLWVVSLGLIFLLGTVLYGRLHYVAECPNCRSVVFTFFWINREI